MLSILAVGWVLVLVAWGLISAAPSPPSGQERAACNDPRREELEELWRIHGDWHESIFNLEDMANVGLTLRNVSGEYVGVKRHDLNAQDCPYGEGSQQELVRYKERAGEKHTICPTYDVINFDENRIPSTLFEKACSCKKCALNAPGERDLLGSHRRRRHSADTTLGCLPVQYYVKVLRRVNCVDNQFIYRPVLEPLVVACSCDHSIRHAREKTSTGILRSPSQ